MRIASMPSRKLTFTFPPDLAAEFLRRVRASLRSQFVATAVADKLREREAQLVRACEAANNSAAVRDIESSFDALADDFGAVQERWQSLGVAKSGGCVWIQLSALRLRKRICHHGRVVARYRASDVRAWQPFRRDDAIRRTVLFAGAVHGRDADAIVGQP